MSAHRLESKRLSLCAWELADWQAFKPIATDPRVMRYISGGAIWRDERIVAFVERQMGHFSRYRFCLWKLELRGERRLAGFCGLQPLDDLPGVEIGWWLASDLWCQGFATEAARLALDDGFTRVGLSRVVAIALRDNRSSIRVIEKLGMRFESEVRHHGFRADLYAIDKKDA